MMPLLAAMTGNIHIGLAALGAAMKLAAQGKINRDETVVLLNTGSGYKYAEAWHAALAP